MVGAPVHPHGVQIGHFMGCTGATYPIRDPISRVRSCCRTRTQSLRQQQNSGYSMVYRPLFELAKLKV